MRHGQHPPKWLKFNHNVSKPAKTEHYYIRECGIYHRATLVLNTWTLLAAVCIVALVHCWTAVRWTVFDSLQPNVWFVCRETSQRFPSLCELNSSTYISYYMSWILIGQRGVTVFLLLLPPLCPARNNDVTLVAMVHSWASRNMPEKRVAAAVFGRPC